MVRDSKFFNSATPEPGGAGYLLDVSQYSADNLVENNIFIKANKVMVMRASGGGNVIGYNYFEDGYIASAPDWVETGANASHMTTPHMELFEGNQAFNFDGDNTWGNAIYITVFRNHFTGKRRSIGLNLVDSSNRRAIGLMDGHWWYSFVGNVLGHPGRQPATPGGRWGLGYNPENWSAPADPEVLSTLLRGGELRLRHELGPLAERRPSRPCPARSISTASRPSSAATPGPGSIPPEPPSSTPSPPGPLRQRHQQGGGQGQVLHGDALPCRRHANRARHAGRGGRPWPPGQTRDFQVTGLCGVPTDALAVAANVTSVVPASPGYLTLFPPGTSSVTSTINFAAGRTRANSATVVARARPARSPSSATPSAAGAHVILDVVGLLQVGRGRRPCSF